MKKYNHGYKIVNLIQIGDGPEVNWADLSPEKKLEIGSRLNQQALEAIGYKKVEPPA